MAQDLANLKCKVMIGGPRKNSLEKAYKIASELWKSTTLSELIIAKTFDVKRERIDWSGYFWVSRPEIYGNFENDVQELMRKSVYKANVWVNFDTHLDYPRDRQVL
jgi:hypothetical protein